MARDSRKKRGYTQTCRARECESEGGRQDSEGTDTARGPAEETDPVQRGKGGAALCRLWPTREPKRHVTLRPTSLHSGKDTQGSCSHHQGGLGHRWLGSWGPGRSCNRHLGPSTSRCCRRRCPPVGQVPEGATPSTRQKGRVSRCLSPYPT